MVDLTIMSSTHIQLVVLALNNSANTSSERGCKLLLQVSVAKRSPASLGRQNYRLQRDILTPMTMIRKHNLETAMPKKHLGS